MRRPLVHIWLCTRSLLNFLIQYMWNIFFSFLSLDTESTIILARTVRILLRLLCIQLQTELSLTIKTSRRQYIYCRAHIHRAPICTIIYTVYQQIFAFLYSQCQGRTWVTFSLILRTEKLLFLIFKLFNPFINSSKVNAVLWSSEGFSALEKSIMICSHMAMLPIQSGVTARCWQ